MKDKLSMKYWRRWTILVIILLIFGLGGQAVSKGGGLYDKLKLFADVLDIVHKEYVEEVDTQKLIYGALRGMLGTLDSNSQFMIPEFYEELRIDSSGHYGGLGMVITTKDNFLTVVSPLEDSPAYRAGIKSGDIILKIDEKITKDMILMESVKLLRGKEGTKVTITVMRNREILPEITLTREIIKLPAVKGAKILEDGIGYIRIVEFREDTGKELEEALRKLEKEGMKALILDLRGNPGGLLDAAVEVADKFLPRKKLIVSTVGRTAKSKSSFFSRHVPHPNYPLVILVDGGSASASEIVAGAIQDYQRGLIVGTKTFGKASVQTVIPLSDNSAVSLTTAKYFTPLGRSIEESKIVPDIIVEFSSPEEEKEKLPFGLELAELQKEIFPSEAELAEPKDEKIKKEGQEQEEKPEKKNKYDTQLEQAVNILKAWPTFRAIMEGEKNAE